MTDCPCNNSYAFYHSADGTYALTGGQDRVVRLWNPHTGNLIKSYEGAHGYEIADIAEY